MQTNPENETGRRPGQTPTPMQTSLKLAVADDARQIEPLTEPQGVDEGDKQVRGEV